MTKWLCGATVLAACLILPGCGGGGGEEKALPPPPSGAAINNNDPRAATALVDYLLRVLEVRRGVDVVRRAGGDKTDEPGDPEEDQRRRGENRRARASAAPIAEAAHPSIAVRAQCGHQFYVSAVQVRGRSRVRAYGAPAEALS